MMMMVFMALFAFLNITLASPINLIVITRLIMMIMMFVARLRWAVTWRRMMHAFSLCPLVVLSEIRVLRD